MNLTDSLRYYIDTEFIEDGRTIELISIGLVCDDGREYYAEADTIPWKRADQWVLDNVKPHLLGNEWIRTKPQMAQEIIEMINQGNKKPQFWGYYADYDWVVFCQLYGRMIDLPEGFPMFCMDLKQLAVESGNPKLPGQRGIEHHALADARWNRHVHQWLLERTAEE